MYPHIFHLETKEFQKNKTKNKNEAEYTTKDLSSQIPRKVYFPSSQDFEQL